MANLMLCVFYNKNKDMSINFKEKKAMMQNNMFLYNLNFVLLMS